MEGADGKLATPTTAGLDLHVWDTALTSVVRDGRDVSAGCRGGEGWWYDVDGLWQFVNVVEEIVLDFGYGENVPEIGLQLIVARMERWVEEKTPLRVTSAPGRYTVLSQMGTVWGPADDLSAAPASNLWLPLPRGTRS